MIQTELITNLSFWQSRLGLLPVGLFPKQDVSTHKYIMLNGSVNNFCLDLDIDSKYESISEYNNYAWSSDVDAFISITEDKVLLYRWDNIEKKPEEYNYDVVVNNIDKFYKYASEKSKSKENGIVPYVIRQFKSIRNAIGENTNPENSISILLYLFSQLESEKHTTITTENENAIISNLTNIDINLYLDLFRKGISYYGVKPNIELILRHASGKLFQEAHYEALLNRQLQIDGTASSIYNTQSVKYSSVHFTPSHIARSIVEESLNSFETLPSELRILDPTCGSGEFLKEVLRQLKNRSYNGKVHLIGWDISPSATVIAKFLLFNEMAEWEGKLNIEIICQDTLFNDWGNCFDIILMNPPFLSWELMSQSARQSVTDILQDLYENKSNLASAFFIKAVKALANDGVIGCVMPSSILNAESYEKLRNFVESKISHKLIAKLGNYVFQNAFTDACLYIGKQNLTDIQSIKIVWTYNAINNASDALRALRMSRLNNNMIINTKFYSIYEIDTIQMSKKAWLPVSFFSWNLEKWLSELLTKQKLVQVKDIFSVMQGSRTGNNDIFLVSKDYYESLGAAEMKLFRPAVVNKAINKGKLSIVNYIWYPYNETGSIIKSENELKGRFYNEFLKPNKHSLSIRKSINAWWELTRPRNWQFETYPKLVSTEFGGSNSYGFDAEGLFVVERGTAWIPRNIEKFSTDIYYAYLSILTSPLFNELLSLYSKQIAGGDWWNLGKKFVDNIPIPDLTNNSSQDEELINELTLIGKRISLGLSVSQENIDALVHKAFGL